MPRTRAVLLLAVFLLTPLAFAQKRRAATPPVPDAHSVAGWLDLNARRLVAAEPFPFTYDLESFGRLTGDATVVALGDDTHGTHEFFTVKHRLIDYLVHDKGFDVVAFEAPFTVFNRLNTWVQGGPGDPQAILAQADRLGYYFWYTEEILDLARSMREYNLHRGNKPAIEIAGFDVFGYLDESKEVIEYLRAVDPAAAVQAETTYACLTVSGSTTCEADVKRFHEQLAARRDELVPLTSARAYADALQSARIVTQRYNGVGGEGRDTSMAENALWLQQNRGTSHKIVLWAHQEHLGESKTKAAPNPMGKQLTAALGANYFVVGTLAGGGQFLQWTYPPGEPAGHLGTGTFREVPADSYEARFAEAGAPVLLVPLEGTLPAWLTEALSYRWAGSAPVDNKPDLVQKESLPAKLDAVIYVAVTTPARSLPR